MKTFHVASVVCLAAMASVSEGADSPTSSGGKVFRCELGGKVTYSDTACEQSADKTKVDTALHNTYTSEPVARFDRPSAMQSDSTLADSTLGPKSPTTGREKSGSIGDEQARHKVLCQQSKAALANAKKSHSQSKMTSTNGHVHLYDARIYEKEIERLEKLRKQERCPY